MNKKILFFITGIPITLLGGWMFYYGVSMFTYQGPPISEFASKLGKYSFFLWLPTIGMGLTLIGFGIFKKKN
jgi:hypothetical protein